jgi:hypothetical protein
MYEETKTFEIKDKTKEEIQFTFEMILEVDLMLSFETKTVFNQIIINFYDEKIVKELQKDNIIKIAQIEDKFHITIKGKLSQSQSAVLWTKFSRDVNVPLEIKESAPLTEPPKMEKSVKEEILEVKKEVEETLERSIEEPEIVSLSREEIIDYLLKSNIEKGFRVTKVDIWNFVENYKLKFKRYLTKSDMESVGIGYIQMLNEKMGLSITEEEIARLEAPPTKEEVKVEETVKPIAELIREDLKIEDISKPEVFHDENDLKIESTQVKTVSERIGEIKKAKTFEKEALDLSAEFAKIKDISLSKKQEGIMTVPKSVGRRKCPNCENSNPRMIHESIDKSIIISHYPRVFGKNYKCGECGCIWREE